MYNISSQKNPHFTNPMTDDYFNQNGSFFHKVNHIPEENFGTKKEELHERKIILKEEPSNDENPSIYKEGFEIKSLKRNLKNTYIKKINELVLEKQRVHENGIITSHSSKDFTTFFDPNKIKKNNSSLSFFENYQDKKLEKNRESARNSRKRKKLYIEMLENRVKNLTEQLSGQKHLIKENHIKFLKIEDYKNKDNSFDQEQLVIDLEDQLIKQNDSSVYEILEKFKLFHETDSYEKSKSIEYFIDQLFEIMIPTHMRYLMWVSSNGRDIFQNELFKQTDKKANEPNWDEILNELDLNDKSKKEILRYKKRLFIEKEKFGSIIKSIFTWKREMKKHTLSLKQIKEEMMNILDMKQISHLLINLHNCEENNNTNFKKMLGWETRKDADEENEDFEKKFELQSRERNNPLKKLHL